MAGERSQMVYKLSIDFSYNVWYNIDSKEKEILKMEIKVNISLNAQDKSELGYVASTYKTVVKRCIEEYLLDDFSEKEIKQINQNLIKLCDFFEINMPKIEFSRDGLEKWYNVSESITDIKDSLIYCTYKKIGDIDIDEMELMAQMFDECYRDLLVLEEEGDL